MSKLKYAFRSTRVRMAVVVAVLTLTGATLMARMDHRTTAERAKSWVASHRAVLPQTLAEYAAYPAEYQQAIFDALSPADKSRLWRAQLDTILARETLTAAQRQFVLQSRADATPASFEPGADHPEVCPTIGTLFTDTKNRRMFHQLGSVVTPSKSWRSTLVSVTEYVRSMVTTSAQRFTCNCRNQGWCECGLVACDTAPEGGCTHNDSCGCIWSSECNGMCDIAMGMTTSTTTTTKTKK